MEIEWEDGFIINVNVENDTVVISAKIHWRTALSR